MLVNLGKLNLNSVIYNLDISITDRNNVGVLAQAQAVKQFSVTSKFVGYAPIQILDDWDGQ